MERLKVESQLTHFFRPVLCYRDNTVPDSWCYCLLFLLMKCFIMFHCRSVFHVVEDVLCVPDLTSVLPTCTLKVINNDTLEEIPRVFLKVVPYVYKKNSVWHTLFV